MNFLNMIDEVLKTIKTRIRSCIRKNAAEQIDYGCLGEFVSYDAETGHTSRKG